VPWCVCASSAPPIADLHQHRVVLPRQRTPPSPIFTVLAGVAMLVGFFVVALVVSVLFYRRTES